MLLGLSGISAYWLMYTAKGLAWYFNLMLANNGATISINKVTPVNSRQIVIDNFHYQTSNIEFRFDTITIVWNPLFSLVGNIEIKEFSADKLTIQTHAEKSNFALSQLKLPVATQLAKGSIREIELITDAGHPGLYKNGLYKNVSFEHLFLYNEVYINYFGITTPSGHKLQLSGMIGLDGDSIVNLTTTAAFKVPMYQNYLHCNGTVVGNLSQLRFLQTIPSPFITTIRGRVKNIVTSPEFVINASIETASNSNSLSTMDIQMLSGTLFGKGTSDEFIVEGNIQVENNDHQRWQTSLASHAKNNRVQFDIVSRSQPDNLQTSTVKLSGHWSLTNALAFPRALHMDAKWNNLTFPVNAKTTIYSSKGTAVFEGDNFGTNINARGITISNPDTVIKQLQLNSYHNTEKSIAWHGTATTNDGKVDFSAGLVLDKNQQFHIENLNVSGTNTSLVQIIQTAGLNLADPGKIYQQPSTFSTPVGISGLNPLQQLSGMINRFLLIAQNSHATDPVQSAKHKPPRVSEIN